VSSLRRLKANNRGNWVSLWLTVVTSQQHWIARWTFSLVHSTHDDLADITSCECLWSWSREWKQLVPVSWADLVICKQSHVTMSPAASAKSAGQSASQSVRDLKVDLHRHQRGSTHGDSCSGRPSSRVAENARHVRYLLHWITLYKTSGPKRSSARPAVGSVCRLTVTSTTKWRSVHSRWTNATEKLQMQI